MINEDSKEIKAPPLLHIFRARTQHRSTGITPKGYVQSSAFYKY